METFNNGIIGSMEVLAGRGILLRDRIDNDKFESDCMECSGNELKRLVSSYHDVAKASATMGNFWDVAGNVLDTVIGIFGGGKETPSCPPCPPIPQKGIMSYALPAAIGFGLGYLILK